MTKKLAALATLLVLAACRSAFAPEPVTRLSAPPAAQLAATVAQATQLRSGPSEQAPATAALEAGAQVQASQEVVHGFRRVKLADGKSGYVDAGVLTVDAPAAAPAAGNPPAAQ